MKNKAKFITSALSVAMLVFAGQATASDRSTYSAYTRGTSTNIPESRVRELCGDIDGCTIRMGMYNWDGSGRVASRTNLFYYNAINRSWRAERWDWAGTTDNGKTNHVMNAWACYFTDGYYRGWIDHGDFTRNFAVLSWNQYNATACRVTLID